jgi:iron complex outermembrane receptor protein
MITMESFRPRGKRARPAGGLGLALALGLATAMPLPTGFAQAPAASRSPGVVTGWVSNQATRNLLGGATVEVPALSMSAQTDATGTYTLREVPDGTHEIVASYAGLDPRRATVRIAGGQLVRQNFDLTSNVYQLGEFKVSADREGAAAALTAQRNANNVKNVIAMDSYGDLPNLSVAELAGLMAGVAVNYSDDGVANGIQVRGAPATQNRVTIDGGLKAGSGVTRQFPSAQFTGAGFAEVELTKGHRPDTGADSLGGTVNLKSRSPLSMAEKRRIDYTASARYAPPFTDQVAWREQHRFHPMLNLGYMEVFDVPGGERNLGVSFHTFYSENANGLFVADRLFQTTDTAPAFLYDYRPQDKYNNRKIYSGRFLADYRFSPSTTYRLIAGYVFNNEPYVQQYIGRVFTNQTVGATGTAGILPGYTNATTEARQTAATQAQVQDQMIGTYRTFGDISLGAEHKWGRVALDYTGAYSWNRFNRDTGKAGGALTHNVANIGWIIDRTRSELDPLFIQTAGPDVTNPASYRPIANGLVIRNQDDYEQVTGFTGNLRVHVLPQRALFLKTGIDWREVDVDQISRDRRYSYIGTEPLAPDRTAQVRSGFNLPHWHPGAFVRNGRLVNPAVWSEDAYFHESLRYTGRRFATETVTAGYLMAEGKLGREGVLARTSFLGGLRREKTETEGRGFVRARTLSSVALQTADPVGAAARDYAANARTNRSDYTKSFPSLHLAHEWSPNLKGRLSWSTSFGRPNMTNMFPSETPNEQGQFITINNPGLLPQDSRNWDANLDYYFKPAGYFSVGWFEKKIRDYIVGGVVVGNVADTTDNGFNGEYRGWEIRSSVNGGTATVRGWEFSYQQQYTFLPGFLKGLSLMATYTRLETNGDFGGRTQLSTGQVAGFVPETINVVPSWRYRRFTGRIRVAYLSTFLDTYNAANPVLNIHTKRRVLVSPSVVYELTPALALTCEVSNVFNAFQERYRKPNFYTQVRDNPTTITFGVKGRL